MKTKRILIGFTVLMLAALACQVGSCADYFIATQHAASPPHRLNSRRFKCKRRIILRHNRMRWRRCINRPFQAWSPYK